MTNRLDNFHRHYEPCPMTGCWLWLGFISPPGKGTTGGYGRSCLNGKSQQAHRVSWQLHRGPIPEGMRVLHHCDVRCCVNPSHLFLGTMLDNTQDAINKGRAPQLSDRPSHCKHGHEFTPSNTYTWTDGQRKCRECAKEAQRKRRSIRRGDSSPLPKPATG